MHASCMLAQLTACGVRRGKRKRAKPPAKKAKPKVATVFDCPFCGKTDSCGCTMDLDHKVGNIACDSCGAKYETRIHRLTDPIDVYAEWIDKCVPFARATARARCLSTMLRLPCCRCEAVNNPGSMTGAAAGDEDDLEPNDDDDE